MRGSLAAPLDFDRVRVYTDPQKVHDQLVPELLDADLLAVDSEWHSYNRDLGQPVNNGLAFSWQWSYRRRDNVIENIYVHAYGASERTTEALRPVFMSPVTKVAHNTPVDWHMAMNHGIRPQNMEEDTMVMDHLLDENRENKHDLKTCARDFLGVVRKDYDHTFGSVKLKKDGTPYAKGSLDVPLLNVYVEMCPVPIRPDQMKDERIPKAFRDRWETLLRYAVHDTYDGLLLREYYKAQLQRIPWLNGRTMWDYYLSTDKPVTGIIQRMERVGMPVDVQFLREMLDVANAEIEQLEADVVRWVRAPINTNSPDHVAKFLFGKGTQTIERSELVENPTPRRKNKKVTYHFEGRGYPVIHRTEKGAPQVSSTALTSLYGYLRQQNTEGATHNLDGFESMLVFKRRLTQRNTYLKGLLEQQRKGRVHGRINQIGTTSSRFSLSNPNLQNVTTGDKDVYHVRMAFEASRGRILVVADYSQIEYRLLAHFSQDPVLLRMFAEGWDMHSLTTYNLFPAIKHVVDTEHGGLSTESLNWIAENRKDERKKGKTLNFEIIYGVGYKKLAEQLVIPHREAKRLIDMWFRGYRNVKPWQESVIREARSRGFVQLIDGRRRTPDMRRLNSKEYGERGEEERTIVNAKVQGSASSMMKRAMIKIDQNPEINHARYDLLMQVHDELIFDVDLEYADEFIGKIRPCMELPFSRPLRVATPTSIQKAPVWGLAK